MCHFSSLYYIEFNNTQHLTNRKLADNRILASRIWSKGSLMTSAPFDKNLIYNNSDKTEVVYIVLNVFDMSVPSDVTTPTACHCDITLKDYEGKTYYKLFLNIIPFVLTELVQNSWKWHFLIEQNFHGFCLDFTCLSKNCSSLVW